jgi:hypothetical protein
MSLLGQALDPFTPSASDLSGAKSGLTLAVQYPGLATSLINNDSLLATSLTASNLIGGVQDPTKNYVGFIFIFSAVFLIGLAIGKFLIK